MSRPDEAGLTGDDMDALVSALHRRDDFALLPRDSVRAAVEQLQRVSPHYCAILVGFLVARKPLPTIAAAHGLRLPATQRAYRDALNKVRTFCRQHRRRRQ